MSQPRIGILAGSGPEAGLDLWSKVLAAQRSRLGTRYRGDIDAPAVMVLSEPELGLSMELEANEERVWEALRLSAVELTASVDVWAIACNTLYYFAERLEQLSLPARLISPDGAAERWLAAAGLTRAGLVGARPVAELGPYSPYTRLARRYRLDVPRQAERERLHALIDEVKLAGAGSEEHATLLAEILAGLPGDSTHVLMACTELPLVPVDSDRRLVDVTALVAAELVGAGPS